jgi:hypothetical protein|tara:strand:- start:137 stop:301 length:165 start_codon:yes stop_codon:yes gene_type:complete
VAFTRITQVLPQATIPLPVVKLIKELEMKRNALVKAASGALNQIKNGITYTYYA